MGNEARTWCCLNPIAACLLAPALCLAQTYTITTVAGGGYVIDGDGGPATSAQIQPLGVVLDGAGDLFIARTVGGSVYEVISEVTPDGILSTTAGSAIAPSQGFSGDGGPAKNAQFSFSLLTPVGMVIDPAGNLYFADTNNQRVRRISPDGTIMTVAGGGTVTFGPPGVAMGDGGPATAAVLFGPSGLALDSAGNVYIADTGSNLVRKVSSDGTITTVAGCIVGTDCFFSLGDGGPATSAMLSMPTALAVDSNDNLYIADTGHNRIRRLATDGTISTVAGSGAGSYQGDGGPATSAGLYQPKGVAVDAAGSIYIDDSGDFRIRMVTPDGTITTIAGNGAQRQGADSSGDGGPATGASLGPLTSGITLGPGGTLYIADPVYGVRLLTPVAD